MKKELLIQNQKNTYEISTKNNPEILFLHGWGGKSENFIPLAEKIKEKTNKEYLISDLPGFGGSDFPPASGWSSEDYANWLWDFLQEQKITPEVVYAHSFGGRIVIHFQEKHPKFFKKIILSGSAGIKLPYTKKQKTLFFLSKITKKIKNIIPESLQKKIKIHLFGARDWAECPTPLKPTLQKTLEEKDLTEKIKKINVPTLLLWGKNDTYTPIKMAEIFKKEISQSKLIIFEDGRHGIHNTHTEKIAEKVQQFLNETK